MKRAFPCFLLVACALLSGCGNPFNNQSFSKQAWSAARSEQRAPMAQDLIRNHIQPGMTTNEIVTLLGQPDSIWLKSDTVGYRVSGKITYAYWIGCWSMQAYDDTYVYVHFDDAGKVIKPAIDGF